MVNFISVKDFYFLKNQVLYNPCIVSYFSRAQFFFFFLHYFLSSILRLALVFFFGGVPSGVAELTYGMNEGL